MSFARGPGVSNYPGSKQHMRANTMRNSMVKTVGFNPNDGSYSCSNMSFSQAANDYGQGRPGTASTSSSIFNVLLKAKKQGAAASHLVNRMTT